MLEAVDWAKEGQPHDEQGARSTWASLMALLNTRLLRKACHQLRMFKLAVQDWTERFWEVGPPSAVGATPHVSAISVRAQWDPTWRPSPMLSPCLCRHVSCTDTDTDLTYTYIFCASVVAFISCCPLAASWLCALTGLGL